MEVTDPEEIKVIEAMRANKAEQAAKKKMMLHVLELAFLYERWLQANGMESSYSTFSDDYGYEPSLYESCLLPFSTKRDIYDRIVSIRSMARGPDKVTIGN